MRTPEENDRLGRLRAMEQRGREEEREFLIATWPADYADRSTA
ncbi:MAG TPA: hypothetical protein VI876_04095 [Dehalococcoidia bacterium]|nr:hypothetical protein [Dehalococcoidia bacterium]